MKRLVLIAALLVAPGQLAFGNVAIVTNATGGGTAEDSVTVAFVVTDSIGNIAEADSFYIALFGPTGDSVFGAAYDPAASEISSMLVGGRLFYRWTQAVADIDGTGRRGSYAGVIVAVDTLDGSGGEYLDAVVGLSFVLAPSLAERSPIGDTINREASTLTSSDRVGLDLDNVTGTLDNAEIGVGAIANTQLADGAISASKVQDYTINAYKIAGNAITATKIADDAVAEFWTFDTSGVSNGMGAMLKDTAAYQGSAAALDSAAIAGWVWNTPQNNHASLGTFGRNLDAPITSLSTGGGAQSLRVVCYDSTLDVVIPYAGVTIHNISQTALLGVGRTSAEGDVVFGLDAESCVVRAFVSGYSFNAGDTVTLSDTEIDTVFGYWFDPGGPALPNLCRVYGHIYGVDGAPLSGLTVTASLPKGTVQSGAVVVSPTMVTTVSDSTGYFYLDVIPSVSLMPPDSKYELTITQSGSTIFRRRTLVPNLTSWRLDWSE